MAAVIVFGRLGRGGDCAIKSADDIEQKAASIPWGHLQVCSIARCSVRPSGVKLRDLACANALALDPSSQRTEGSELTEGKVPRRTRRLVRPAAELTTRGWIYGMVN